MRFGYEDTRCLLESLLDNRPCFNYRITEFMETAEERDWCKITDYVLLKSNNDMFCFETVKDDDKGMAAFLSLANCSTEYGEPQLWLYLRNGRSVEITHEEEGLMLDRQFYSVRLHCTDDEFASDDFHSTVGVIDQQIFNEFSLEDMLDWVIKTSDSVPIKSYDGIVGGFIRTDDYQRIKPLGNRRFLCIDGSCVDGKVIITEPEIVDVNDYFKNGEPTKELKSIVRCFHGSWDEFLLNNPKEQDQIIAEMIYETKSSLSDIIVNEDEADDAIDKWCLFVEFE